MTTSAATGRHTTARIPHFHRTAGPEPRARALRGPLTARLWVKSRTSNAQSSPGRPLIRNDLQTVADCTNAATRRTETASVAAPRHRFIEAACSPLARWQGESDGSDPLRPPARVPAASRCEDRLRFTANSTSPIDRARDFGRVSS